MLTPDPRPFAVRTTSAGSTLLVEVVGEIDMTTAPELSQVIERMPDGTELVVIDLAEVSFLDSSGLNALVQARRMAAGRDVAMTVVVPPDTAIRRVFEITHLTEPLTVIDARPPLA
jgi:anti-sigma B factor antagonist